MASEPPRPGLPRNSRTAGTPSTSTVEAALQRSTVASSWRAIASPYERPERLGDVPSLATHVGASSPTRSSAPRRRAEQSDRAPR